MKMNVFVPGLTLGFALILVNFTIFSDAQLQFGFYAKKCQDQTVDVEKIVHDIVNERIKTDPTLVAALLRMQFHDCFVKGCDASLLLDGAGTEKTAPPNLSVRGYELIDEIKKAVESKCKPKTVSCADIIVMATRDAVSLSGGNKYDVQTGRLDGKVSLATDVNLPSPRITVSDSITAFKNKGLSPTEMVLLLGGGHTVGITHCSLFKYRLYSYNATFKQDPTMNNDLAKDLKNICHESSDTDNIEVNLDQTSGNSLLVDNGFYKRIKDGKGILEIDQAIALNTDTSKDVNGFSVDAVSFQSQFAAAMVKLGAVMDSGSDGEIRENCRTVNNPSSSGSSNSNPLMSNIIP